MWEEIGDIKDELLEQCKLIVNEADYFDNEGTDIYTEEDFRDWDTTLMDGLEDLDNDNE